jgi:hypothetical protein
MKNIILDFNQRLTRKQLKKNQNKKQKVRKENTVILKSNQMIFY